MKFEWDKNEWIEGDAPAPHGLLDFVRDHPSIFFVASVGAFVVVAMYGGKVAMYGGKVVMWFVNLIVG